MITTTNPMKTKKQRLPRKLKKKVKKILLLSSRAFELYYHGLCILNLYQFKKNQFVNKNRFLPFANAHLGFNSVKTFKCGNINFIVAYQTLKVQIDYLNNNRKSFKENKVQYDNNNLTSPLPVATGINI